MKGLRKDKAVADRRHAEQMRQRVRVGMIGLAAVVLLIGLASAIFSSVNREAPVVAAGAPPAETVANMSGPTPLPSATATNEPLAEMGVTPSTANPPAHVPSPDGPSPVDPAQ